MGDTYFNPPGRRGKLLGTLLFYVAALAALAVLVFLAAVVLGFVPVAEPY